MSKQIEPEHRIDSRLDSEDSHQAALLIDFDNVTMGIRSNLGQEMRNLLNSDVIRGKVAVQRAYADWRRYPQYIVPLSEASIDLIFAPAYGSSKKNATDIRLAIDALELVFIRPEIRTFILMSGDSDFSSLVLKLKEYGKYVIGVGIQESSSDLLVQNCDEYYSYSALSGLSKEGEQPTERHDPWVLVEKAIAKMVQRGDTMRSDRLKQVMLEIDPSFNEKEQGFSKFNRFVVEAASRGLISIQKMENGQYGVAPAGTSPKSDKGEKGDRAAAKPEAEKESRRSRGRRDGGRRSREQRTTETAAPTAETERADTRRARPKLTMKTAIELLNKALDQLLEDKTAEVRDSDVKRRLLELQSDFDEGELGFSKFSKFLQAAEERDVVRLTRGPNGNYHVGRPRAPRGKKTRERSKRSTRATPSTASTKTDTTEAAPMREEAPEPRETTVRRLARFLFGGRKEEHEETDAPAAPPPKHERPAHRSPGERSSRGERSTGGPGERSGRGRGPRGESRNRAESSGRRSGPDAGKTEGQRRDRRAPSARRERGSRGEAERRQASTAPGGRRQDREGRRERTEEERPGQEAVAAASADRAQSSASVKEADAAPQREERGGERKEMAAVAPPPPAEAATSAGAEQAESAEQPGESSPAVESRPGSTEGETQPAVAPAPMPGSPRGTIRGRWGSRGRYRPSGTPPPIFEGQRSPRASAVEESSQAGERSDTGHAHIIEHLKTHYSGVGEKTAETLVETFGADLFRIMDEQPDRIRTVLPDHRADRVLEARRQEREAGSS